MLSVWSGPKFCRVGMGLVTSCMISSPSDTKRWNFAEHAEFKTFLRDRKKDQSRTNASGNQRSFNRTVQRTNKEACRITTRQQIRL